VNDVAKAINAWRQQHELTQDEIGRITGVSLPTAGNWCRGSAKPNLDQIALMEEARPGLIERLFGPLDRLEATFDAGLKAGREVERRLLQEERAAKAG
jgi:transcriptional regulator with XRE-family HTH domain